MKIDFEKAKQLLEEKPNLTEEEYNKGFGIYGRNNRGGRKMIKPNWTYVDMDGVIADSSKL